jgi:hypothetical protein
MSQLVRPLQMFCLPISLDILLKHMHVGMVYFIYFACKAIDMLMLFIYPVCWFIVGGYMVVIIMHLLGQHCQINGIVLFHSNILILIYYIPGDVDCLSVCVSRACMC